MFWKGFFVGIAGGSLGFLATFVFQFIIGLIGGTNYGLDMTMWPIGLQFLGSNVLMILSTVTLGTLFMVLLRKKI